ncbi:MAG: class I SAM-dependent methyltransferase [Candidatus Acidiferrales bacterium]
MSPTAVARVNEFLHDTAELPCTAQFILPVVRAGIENLPAKSVVAEAGCGNGSMLGELRGYGFDLHGLDVSESGLAHAKKNFRGIEFTYADLTADLSNHALAGKCGAVISTEVVEHIFLPRIFARNCYRLLKPGGKLILSTPYHGYLKNVALAPTGKLETHFTALWDYGHIKFWSRQTLGALLEEAGFEVVGFHGAGRVPFLWKSMILVATKR